MKLALAVAKKYSFVHLVDWHRDLQVVREADMLDRQKNAASVTYLKYLCIALFVCSLIFIFIYGNFLMVSRPRTEVPSEGLMYPFFGKGGTIFISKLDYGLMIGSGIFLIASMVGANRFAKMASKR